MPLTASKGFDLASNGSGASDIGRLNYDPIMPRSKDDSGLYEPRGSTHFNIKYKGAAALSNRALARDLQECRYLDIEWVWIVRRDGGLP